MTGRGFSNRHPPNCVPADLVLESKGHLTESCKKSYLGHQGELCERGSETPTICVVCKEQLGASSSIPPYPRAPGSETFGSNVIEGTI